MNIFEENKHEFYSETNEGESEKDPMGVGGDGEEVETPGGEPEGEEYE